jgi:2-iminobutanoate/2-iminopropanoate deaminase
MTGLITELGIPGLPPPLGPYAHATLLGNQIFVSGLLALDAKGLLVGPGDATAQAEHIFATLGIILSSAGSDFGDVAKLTIYLINLDDRVALSEVRKRVFGAHRPASTLVQVAGLIGDGTLMEIEAIAAKRSVSAPAAQGS